MNRVLPYNAKQWEIPLLLDGRKTAIRCIIQGKVVLKPEMEHEVTFFPYKCRKDNGQEIKCIRYFTRESFMKYEAPYQPGDILYVREQWAQTTDLLGEVPQYIYQADWGELGSTMWRPSSCMPKEADRIFLQVINVRAEQLQDITKEQEKAEGFSCKDEFIKAFHKIYPNCTEESWVWVIEFERCEKPEREGK